MGKYKKINDKIRAGYAFVEENNSLKACDIWLDAWEDLKEIYANEKPKSLDELNDKYDWCEFLINYVQDLELELGNAGQYAEEYYEKRIRYCEEMIGILEEDEQLTIENTKRAIAESYYALGDAQKCDQLYTNWLNEDPDWGWGYIAWSDCYGFGTNKIKPDLKRAEEIIKIALAKPEIRDQGDVLMRAIEIYEDSGQKEKANELKAKYCLERKSKAPVKAVKIGRNEPCPCGSGKKYKKCCGRN